MLQRLADLLARIPVVKLLPQKKNRTNHASSVKSSNTTNHPFCFGCLKSETKSRHVTACRCCDVLCMRLRCATRSALPGGQAHHVWVSADPDPSRSSYKFHHRDCEKWMDNFLYVEVLMFTRLLRPQLCARSGLQPLPGRDAAHSGCDTRRRRHAAPSRDG